MITNWHKRTVPVLMVRNEAYWISQVLRPLVAVFGTVLLGDTGSTDDTVEIARRAGAEVIEFGEQSSKQLGQVRHHLGLMAAERGASWIFQVDGDELYNLITLRDLIQQPLPQQEIAGYTTMLSLDGDYIGTRLVDVFEMDDLFNRLALIPAACSWTGDYPFEVPVIFENPRSYHYFALPIGYRYHALHLHRLLRSPHDDQVMLRDHKRFQFSMQEKQVARIRYFDMQSWLIT